MVFRQVSISDWPVLKRFYDRVYPLHHPLQDFTFWQWRFGNTQFGSVIVGEIDGEIVTHLGIVKEDGYLFGINLYIDEAHRNGDSYLSLIEEYAKMGDNQIALAATNDAVNLLRLLKWYQYVNIERRIIVNPSFENKKMRDLLSEVSVPENLSIPEGHFWKQPQLKSLLMEDGSTAILQPETGGLRFVEIKSNKNAVNQAFEMGFAWCDFVTSFNNPILLRLDSAKWKTENELGIPWFLNPVVPESRSNLTFLSKKPLDLKFYINRKHADLGRVGRIINQ